ncbi:ROK family transcriptional regulator [Jonesia quinghaiensis]|uniref:ROK family transcriptional regulator n=1 Tax=Jonesia quinghaiensis TaxID=262806 RepID=UPI0004078408|nr:ROK family transcriptional regulator [Jonesia quinghaiensis]
MARITTSTGRRATQTRTGAESTKVLPADVRHLHRTLLLTHLYKSDPKSRADLARATGLTRVTVSDVVTDLLDRSLVREVGTRPGTRVGKPATLVTVDYESHAIVCLDLSRETEFRGAVTTLSGDIIHREALTLDEHKGDDALAKVITLAKKLITSTTSPVVGLGVGTPGIVSAEGVVRNAPNLGWRDLNLAEVLHRELGVPAYVANDADTAVLAESTFGAGDATGLMLVQIGHGVGAGILCDSHLLRGPEGTAGEIGHVRISDDNVPCSCGRTGCLEAYLAAPKLRARIEGCAPDQVARELTTAGQQLGRIIAPVTQALGIFDVALLGPEDLLTQEFLTATQEAVHATTSHFMDRDVVIRLSALGHDGVIHGAAAHVLAGELGLS